jgi:cytochrome c-type biogenesis protein CcmH
MIIFWLIIALMTCVASSILVLPLLQQRASKTIWLCIGLLVILSLSLYWKLGASQKVAELQHQQIMSKEIQKLGSLANVIATLKQQVALHPAAEGFSLLGRLYLKTQAFQEAADAFLKANQLQPDQPAVLIGYAESSYFLQQRVLTAQAKQFLNRALQLQPKQPDALNLLAMDAYQRGDYAGAIKAWEQVLPQLEEGTEMQQKLLQMIGMAEKKLKN